MPAPPDLSTSAPSQTDEIARAIALITSELGLVGLNSADFLVSADAVWLLEVNPRPGATLDVFEPDEGALFAHHVAACDGRLTPSSPSLMIKAAEIVYAPYDIVLREDRIGQIGWSIDRRLERALPPAIRCARRSPPVRPSIWREPAPTSGREKSSLLLMRRNIERRRDHKRQPTRRCMLTAALRGDAAMLNLGVASRVARGNFDRRRRRAARLQSKQGCVSRKSAWAGLGTVRLTPG